MVLMEGSFYICKKCLKQDSKKIKKIFSKLLKI